jgi:hypothetical protein
VIANRVFVGDREGTVWRVDLKSTDPDQWKVEPFFDTASKYAFNEGQPITGAPVLSLDPLGNLVVIVSTGDQDQLTATPNMHNSVWSLRESAIFASGGATAGKIQSKANWHLGRGDGEGGTNIPVGLSTNWTNGERVTGPMTLFNGVVYFSTFRPAGASAAACDNGTSALWAVDYRLPASGTQGPIGRLVFEGDTFDAETPAAQIESNAIIFGVGLNRTPTCYDTDSYTDPFLGFGTSTSVSNLSPGGYQLVVQTGNQGSGAKGSQTNTKTFKLPSPPSAVRIDSWAAIVELSCLPCSSPRRCWAAKNAKIPEPPPWRLRRFRASRRSPPTTCSRASSAKAKKARSASFCRAGSSSNVVSRMPSTRPGAAPSSTSRRTSAAGSSPRPWRSGPRGRSSPRLRPPRKFRSPSRSPSEMAGSSSWCETSRRRRFRRGSATKSVGNALAFAPTAARSTRPKYTEKAAHEAFTEEPFRATLGV